MKQLALSLVCVRGLRLHALVLVCYSAAATGKLLGIPFLVYSTIIWFEFYWITSCGNNMCFFGTFGVILLLFDYRSNLLGDYTSWTHYKPFGYTWLSLFPFQLLFGMQVSTIVETWGGYRHIRLGSVGSTFVYLYIV